MKLVIEIPESKYTDIMRRSKVICLSGYEEVIANGTPLPKHGRLIDADTLWDSYHDNDYDFYEALDDTPTIIPTDKEDEE